MRAHRSRPLTVLVPLTVAVATVGGGITAASAQAPTDPKQLLGAAAANLAKAKSLHVTSVSKDDDGTFRISADVLASGNADISLTQGKAGTFRLRKVSSATFLRGDATYWRTVGGKGKDGAAAARALAGRWIRVSKSDAKEFSGLFTEFTPKALARCATAEGVTGTLSLGAPAKVGSVDASVLIDAGDLPGTAPGRIFLSTGAKPVPLRAVVTGPVKPGGKETACTDPKSTTTSSDIRFSKYDRKLSIRAPKRAIRIPSTSGGGSDSPSISR